MNCQYSKHIKGNRVPLLQINFCSNPLHLHHNLATLTETDLRFLFYPNSPQQVQVLNKISVLNDRAHVPMLIDFVQHFKKNTPKEVLDTLAKISGENFQQDWFAWRQWQEQNEFAANPLYILFKSYLFQQYNPDFLAYIHPGLLHVVALEDVHFAEISQFSNPPLFNPAFGEASLSELSDDEPVIGIAHGTIQKAFPLKYLEVNLSVNDKIDGKGYSLTYCPFSGSPTCFITDLGTSGSLVMTHSGLYRKGNLLFATPLNQSLWQNLGNTAIIGSMVQSGLELNKIPVTRSTWGDWKTQNPDSLVMLPPVFMRTRYLEEQPFQTYENSPQPMYPVFNSNDSVQLKEWVCGLNIGDKAKAWPLKMFEENSVLNTKFNDLPIVIIADSKDKTVRIFQRGQNEFSFNADQKLVDKNSTKIWNMSELKLQSSDGNASLERIPNSLCYWFAWQAHYPKTELGQLENK